MSVSPTQELVPVSIAKDGWALGIFFFASGDVFLSKTEKKEVFEWGISFKY